MHKGHASRQTQKGLPQQPHHSNPEPIQSGPIQVDGRRQSDDKLINVADAAEAGAAIHIVIMAMGHICQPTSSWALRHNKNQKV